MTRMKYLSCRAFRHLDLISKNFVQFKVVACISSSIWYQMQYS